MKAHHSALPLRLVVATLAYLLAGLTCAFAQQAGVDSEVISRFVRNNQEQMIWTSWEIGDDCKVVRGFNVKVGQMPQQGTVELRRNVRMITEGWLNNYRLDARHVALIRKCQGVELPVISVFFRANPGYVGFDSMKIFITSTNGRQRNVDIRLSIR